MRSLRLALPKGRLSDEAIAYLQEKGIVAKDFRFDERRLIYQTSQLEILMVRARDVGQYVESQAADLGIVGEDMLQEYGFDVFVALCLPFGYCRLSVAHKKDDKSWLNLPTIRVATKYPKLASRYFFERGLYVQIYELYGSVELAPHTGLCDIIVDLVSTGQTLKAHGLQEEETILHSSARLIINPTSFFFQREAIRSLLDALNSS
ncbi:MAG: ATP phosphoribosyltransferase [Leptospiraceae bacterium]|nr:ATP phosphoribosyltransferase [Leptospiraceae bacterium]MDW8306415.1 ATP phosphoribosyltransferase [Leptospiraceae bacterium]